jgi:hypothetical protein
MKKILLSVFTAIAAYGFSQSTILITNVSASQSLAPNATVNVATNASSNSQVTFDIKNTSGSQQSYNAIRYDVTLNAELLPTIALQELAMAQAHSFLRHRSH